MLFLFVLSVVTATLPSRTSLTWPSPPLKLLARNPFSPHFLLSSLPLQSLVPLMAAIRADPTIHCPRLKDLSHPCHHYWPLSCGTAEMHHHSINFCCRLAGWSVIWVKGIMTGKWEEKHQDYPFLLAHNTPSSGFILIFPISPPSTVSSLPLLRLFPFHKWQLPSVKGTGISPPTIP